MGNDLPGVVVNYVLALISDDEAFHDKSTKVPYYSGSKTQKKLGKLSN